MQQEMVLSSTLRLVNAGGVLVEEQNLREMRRKILEVSLGQIYTTVNVSEDEIINDNDILFLQSLPDDETRDPNALYLCIVNKASGYMAQLLVYERKSSKRSEDQQ